MHILENYPTLTGLNDKNSLRAIRGILKSLPQKGLSEEYRKLSASFGLSALTGNPINELIRYQDEAKQKLYEDTLESIGKLISEISQMVSDESIVFSLPSLPQPKYRNFNEYLKSLDDQGLINNGPLLQGYLQTVWELKIKKILGCLSQLIKYDEVLLLKSHKIEGVIQKTSGPKPKKKASHTYSQNKPTEEGPKEKELREKLTKVMEKNPNGRSGKLLKRFLNSKKLQISRKALLRWPHTPDSVQGALSDLKKELASVAKIESIRDPKNKQRVIKYHIIKP